MNQKREPSTKANRDQGKGAQRYHPIQASGKTSKISSVEVAQARLSAPGRCAASSYNLANRNEYADIVGIEPKEGGGSAWL